MHDPEGLLDRPRQLPRSGKKMVEDKVYSVIFQSIDILLMVIHYDNRTELIHEINANSSCHSITVPTPRALASWTP